MMNDSTPMTFRWPRPDGELGWRLDLHPSDARHRTCQPPHLVATEETLSRPYEPLRTEPGLFREFADLEPERGDIQSFVERYGWLGIWRPLVPRDEPQTPVTGESLHEWRAEIETLHEAVALWDMIQRKDRSALGEVIRWRGGDYGRGVYYAGTKPTVIAAERWYPDELGHLDSGDIIGPAVVLLQHHVNMELKRERATGVPAAPALVWADSLHQRLELRVQPKNLIGALWVQLAQAIDGNRNYRRCGACGKWFETGKSRGNPRKYCSDACRQRARRARTEDTK